MLALLTVSLIICAAAAVPVSDEMCTPLQSTAALNGRISKFSNEELQIFSSEGKLYIDYTKRMQALDETTFSDGNVTEHVVKISDYNQNKSYKIFPEYEICDVRDDIPDASHFKRPCKADLKLIDSLDIKGKMADVFVMTFPNTTLQTTVMRDDFTPMFSIIMQSYSGGSKTIAYQYGNVSTTIDDPSVFNLPSYCSDGMPQEAKETEKTKMDHTCVAAQYEAKAVGKRAQLDNGTTTAVFITESIATDFTNKLEAVASVVEYGSNLIKLNKLYDWNKMVFYEYNPDRRLCVSIDPPMKEMIRLCSDSEEAHLESSMMVYGEMADIYRVDYANPNITEYVTVFRDTFQRISAIANEDLYAPLVVALQYGNYTEGIQDRSVFDIPNYCQT